MGRLCVIGIPLNRCGKQGSYEHVFGYPYMSLESAKMAKNGLSCRNCTLYRL